MKRRSFLTSTSAVGITGVISGGSVVSSIYSSISTNLLLEEFNLNVRNVLDKFLADAKLNIKSLGLEESIATRMVMPTQIISNDSTKSNQSITYKNKYGEYISLSVTKGVERIDISKTMLK